MATEIPTCIISIKIATHMFAAFTCINAAEKSNYMIATETVTYVIATKGSTNIIVAKCITNIIAIEPQNLHSCNRRWPLHNCYRKSQLHSLTEAATRRVGNRNFHLQKWCQSEILLVIIKKFSE